MFRNPFSNTSIINKAPQNLLDALFRLQQVILSSLEYDTVITEVVNSIFKELGFLKYGYEIVVLTLVDQQDQTLKRISVSQTKKAMEALKLLTIPFHQIVIPLSYKSNTLIKVIDSQIPAVSTYWPDILSPAFTEEEALLIQQKLGIQASLIYPIMAKGISLGSLIFSMNKPVNAVSSEEKELLRGFSDMVGLAVQNATLYSQLEETSKKLEKANRHLKHLDKLKNEFIFIATHELKNPVTAMRGYTSMLQEGMYGALSDKVKEPVNQLHASSQQLVDLVNDLLSIARSEAKTLTIFPEKMSLCQTIDVIKENVKILAQQKGLTIQHGCRESNLLFVKADPQRVKEILNNLLSNAIKYSEKGTITISHEEDEQHIITHVKDEGYGISPEDQKKLFVKFFRVEEEAAKGIPGTGLGLFIIKEFIEKMGGKIWLESEKGVGSTFSFSLPKAK
jgi:signal transduction histidine kinase